MPPELKGSDPLSEEVSKTSEERRVCEAKSSEKALETTEVAKRKTHVWRGTEYVWEPG